jgi:hypothetical protein
MQLAWIASNSKFDKNMWQDILKINPWLLRRQTTAWLRIPLRSRTKTSRDGSNRHAPYYDCTPNYLCNGLVGNNEHCSCDTLFSSSSTLCSTRSSYLASAQLCFPSAWTLCYVPTQISISWGYSLHHVPQLSGPHYSLQDRCDLADVPSNPFNCHWTLVVRSHLPAAASSSLSSS